MRRPLAAAAVLATVAAAPAPASAADPSWQRLDVPFGYLPPAISLTGLPGRQAMVYYHNPIGEPQASHGTRIVERVPGGAFSAPQEIGRTTLTGAVFADSGDSVVVENTTSSTKTGFRPAGGPPAPLAAFAQSTWLGADANAAGAALAAFRTASNRLNVSDRPAGAAASFAPPATVPGDPEVVSAGFFPFVAPVLDADGSAAVLFSATGSQLKAVYRTGTGAFGGAVAVAVPAGVWPRLATNQAGDAALVWRDGAAVRVAYRPRGETFGAAETVVAHGDGRTPDADPVAAIDGSGRVFAAWPTNRPGTYACDTIDRYRLVTAFRATSGAWSVKPDRPGQQPVVAASGATDPAAARFLVAYQRPDPRLAGCPGFPTRRVVAELGAFDAVPAPEILPAQEAGDEGVYNIPGAAAVTPAGQAVVAYDTDHNDGEAAAFEVPARGGQTKVDETPVAKDDKPVIVRDEAPVGFTGSGPSGARGPDVGARQSGGTLGVDPRIFSPVPPPVRVSRLGQGIPVTLGCALACAITVSGQVQVGSGRAARAAKVSRIALKATTVRLKAGERRTVRVKVPRRAVGKIRRAVRRRQRAVALLTIAAPGARPRTLRVKLRP